MLLINRKLKELSKSEIRHLSGGTFNYFGYAMGYVVGTVQAAIEGAYQQGYDEAQDNCDCK